jgi:hypothetical protein
MPFAKMRRQSLEKEEKHWFGPADSPNRSSLMNLFMHPRVVSTKSARNHYRDLNAVN